MIDLRGIVGYTDYFVICSGNTDRQTKAIHDAIHKRAEGRGRPAAAPRGGRARRAGSCMDHLDCVVHIFTPEARAYYRLERLWGEAPVREVR